MLLKYIRSRLTILAFFVMFALVYALLCALCDLPMAAVRYASLVCASLALILLVPDYLRFASRMRRLLLLERNPEDAPAALPEPQDAKEAVYARMLRAQRTGMLERERKNRELLAERSAYYTVWTHQIKTPIAAMRLVLQDMAGEEATALRGELRRIEQYAQMALCYIRLDSPDTDYLFRHCELDEILRSELRQASPLFIRNRIALKYEPLHYTALTDEKWLGFVIGQILSNALKYTPPGGRIEISMPVMGTLEIGDTGVGIPEEDLPRVTENGFTGANGRADKCATGLGLYLSRRILSALGHELRIESGRGEGTRVRILLDREKSE